GCPIPSKLSRRTPSAHLGRSGPCQSKVGGGYLVPAMPCLVEGPVREVITSSHSWLRRQRPSTNVPTDRRGLRYPSRIAAVTVEQISRQPAREIPHHGSRLA